MVKLAIYLGYKKRYIFGFFSNMGNKPDKKKCPRLIISAGGEGEDR
jgi:hypothetical protein